MAELTRQVNQHGTMLDSQGNILAAVDATTGVHLGRPYLPIVWASSRPVFYHLFYASGATVAGETLWHATFYKQHPKVIIAVDSSTEDGATNGAMRLLANGTQLGSDRTFGTAAARTVLGPHPVPGGHLDLVTLTLQAWRTSGTALVRVWPQDSFAVES